MFGFIGDTVAGGFDAVGNIVSGAGQAFTTLASGFYPTPQRTEIPGTTTMGAENAGLTYRPTEPEGKSIIETFNYAADLWVNTPYEDQYALMPKVNESLALSKTMAGGTKPTGFLESLADIITGGAKVFTEVSTAARRFAEDWGIKPRGTQNEKPRAGYPEGKNVQTWNELTTKGAEVLQVGQSLIGGFLQQVKGLFNLGFDQTGKQPVIGLRHEIQPSGKTTIGIGVVIAIVIGLVLYMRKK